jgi:hypothetical protein
MLSLAIRAGLIGFLGQLIIIAESIRAYYITSNLSIDELEAERASKYLDDRY